VKGITRFAAALAALLAVAIPAVAGAAPATGRLRVAVVDETTKAPIVFARAEIYGPRSLRGVSGTDGVLVFTRLPAGAYEIVVENAAYVKQTLKNVAVGDGEARVTVAMHRAPPAPASRLKQIGTTNVSAEKPVATQATLDAPAARISGTILGAVAGLPGVTLQPNGDVSLFGHPTNQTAVTVDGIPVSGLGATPNVQAFGLDLFDAVGVGRSAVGASGGALAFQTRNPSLDWIGAANGVVGSFGNTATSFLESGTQGRIGVSLTHAIRDEGTPLDGLGFADTSGFDYVHDAISHTVGDSVKLRYPLSQTNVLFATAVSLRSEMPLVCTTFSGVLPCGYGPNNRQSDTLFGAQLRDTFQRGRLAGYASAYRTRDITDIDQNGLFLAGVSMPQRSVETTASTGANAHGEFQIGTKGVVIGDVSTRVQQVSSSGSAFGSYVPPTLQSLSDTRASLATDLVKVRHLSARVTLGVETLGGSTSATEQLDASFTPRTSETYTLAVAAGNGIAAPSTFAGIAAPDALRIDCEGGVLSGFGPSQGVRGATNEKASLAWSHLGKKISPTITLRHDVDFDALLSGTVPAGTLDATLFTPGYLAQVARNYATTCGASAALPSLANLFYTVSGAAARTTYDGGDARVRVDFSRNVQANATFSYTHARATGSGTLFAPGSTLQVGRQLPNTPFSQADVQLAAKLGRSYTTALVDVRYLGTNNASNLPAYAVADIGLDIRLPHGPRFDVGITNLTNTYAGTFTTARNAVAIPTSYGGFPTLAAPQRPRGIAISARIPFGPGAQLDDVVPYDIPFNGYGYEANEYPAKPPTDAFTLNRRSGFCGPESVATATHLLGIVRAYVARIESVRRVEGRYPAAFPSEIRDGVQMHYRPNGASYAVLIGVDQGLSSSERIAVAKPLFGCSNLATEDLQRTRELGLYIPTYDEHQELQTGFAYAPLVGLYVPPSVIENTGNIAFIPSPETPPADPFAIKTSCGEELRPAVDAFVAAFRPYVAAVDAGLPPTKLPEGVAVDAHRGANGTWYELHSRDLDFATIASCFAFSSARPEYLQKRGIDGTSFGISFSTKVGFYNKIIMQQAR
jgi:hypothetical protein